MKTYAISLFRVKERHSYIKNHLKQLNIDYEILDAVDGMELSEDDIKAFCNMEQVQKYRWWLTNGAIACALSHLKAYEAFLRTDNRVAFIMEDDFILPKNIKEILNFIENHIANDEIILLDYRSFKMTQLSTIGKKETAFGSLLYPMDLKDIIGAGAYVIGKDAAMKMKGIIIPINVTADSWHYFFINKAFSSIKVLYPSVVSSKHFKSSIDYLKKGSLKQVFSSFVNKYRIPILYQCLYRKRKHRVNTMWQNFELVNKESAIYNNRYK